MALSCWRSDQMLSGIWGLADLPSGFCLHRSRQPRAVSWFPASCLRLEAARCVSVTLLRLVQHSSRKKKKRKGKKRKEGKKKKGLKCCCLSLLFSVHFMQLQTQQTLTQVH